MAVSPLLGSPKPQFFDSNGDPLSGGMVEFYAGGGSTPLDTFTTTVGDVANSNPVVLNSRGEPPAQINATENLAYKAVLKTADGVVLWTEDNIFSSNTISTSSIIPYLNATLEKNAGYTVVADDRAKLIRCTANTFTVTLLPAATATEGFVITVTNDGSGVITVDPDAGELVNGVANITLEPGEHTILTCTGSAWNGPRYIKGIPVETAAGTVDAMTATFTPTVRLIAGSMIQINAVGQITSTTPSLALNGGAAKQIVRSDGSALKLTDITTANQMLLLLRNSIGNNWSLVNPNSTSLIILDTPELLASGLTEGAWTTISSSTLSIAKAQSAIISIQCEAVENIGPASINFRGESHLRQTGSGLAADVSTRKSMVNLFFADTNNHNVNLDMGADGHVSLDGSYDFDYYLTSDSFTWDSKVLYLIGYYA